MTERAEEGRLVAASHEAVMTERRGLFRVICGCGWVSDFAAIPFVEADHDAHLGEVRRGEL